MRFAVQENLVSGKSFAEKVNNIQVCGYEGMELNGEGLKGRIKEIKAGLHNSGISATAICGGYKFGLLYPDSKDREQSRREIKELLALGSEVGVEGVIIVPIFHGPLVPDLSPWKSSAVIEKELLIEQLHDLAEAAREYGTKLILEPLNRYETHFMNRLEQAVQICEQVGSKHVSVLADFFHMNIEEANIQKAIKEASEWLSYVHLADSNRQLPGLGHNNFQEGFEALKEVNYKGWMSLECAVPNNEEALKKSLEYMKNQL